MLESINLDNETFEAIVERAMRRIPSLCPDWTDYNEHDPGVTLIELFAWYKEMQQYHMNRVTPEIKHKLLKLLGLAAHGARPASCLVEPEGEGTFLKRTRLYSDNGIYELEEPARAGGPVIASAYIRSAQGVWDVSEVLMRRSLSLPVFSYGGQSTSLMLGVDFNGRDCGALRLWFDVNDDYPVSRNPFKDGGAPRKARFDCVGAGQARVTRDETHALSASGFITLDPPAPWPSVSPCAGLPERRYLEISLDDPGCEEEVRLDGVVLSRFRASQRETWASAADFTVEPGTAEILLEDALSANGNVIVLKRAEDGYELTDYSAQACAQGLRIRFDASGVARDYLPNVKTVSLDAVRAPALVWESNGLPGQRISLRLGERELFGAFELMCASREGFSGMQRWVYTDNLRCARPGDRVFTYDEIEERLIFGDGGQGAVVPRGAAVIACSLSLTLGQRGNAPQGGVFVSEGGARFSSTAVAGGKSAASVDEALKSAAHVLDDTDKCATAGDYERLARQTPGLRVAAARAIAGLDLCSPVAKPAYPVVTVVVIPFSQHKNPMPNERFLDCVYRYLDARRTVCTVLRVIAPTYAGVAVRVEAAAEEGAGEEITLSIESFLREGNPIGRGVSISALEARVGALGSVLVLKRLSITCPCPGCRVRDNGDVDVPANAVAYLQKLEFKNALERT